MSGIIERIERESGVEGLVEILAERLNPSDLQSLLIKVTRRRADKRRPAELLKDFATSRFFGVARPDRAALLAWEQLALALCEGRFEPVELSPVTPLGACSVVATVDQDWSIGTTRRGEVVSDPTNVLALEAARLRQAGGDDVHLAASHRVVRPQNYGDGKMLAHFRLFALVSGGRDRGGYGFEAEALRRQVGLLLEAFGQFLAPGTALRLGYTRTSAPNVDARLEALRGVAEANGAELFEEVGREAAGGYYAGFCFHIFAGDMQLADGGVVDWGAKLTGNGKERMVISGCGVERLLALRG
ncbi:hypothetical protein VW23_021865 [Devosia insulae DS-56]|uniref:Uncharacterized protein n=1 Tax=Devosia insulae DS-56 TaxID=1116389 RepID=A0A1E5XP22_9HYPH|nr:hypothetical protein [Devosia insulae]OEO30325.1 hypothetical protein VW23_021865 [Devosia insulae DS-56]